MKPPRPALQALGVLALLGLAQASSARDAKRVQVVTIGRSGALAACEGLDASNANRSRVHFPKDAELTLRIRLPGGIGQAPAADEAGNLIISHVEPRLSKVDLKGRTLWSVRLPSEASCAPVLLSSGAILLVTREAEVFSFSPEGRLEVRAPLAFSDPRRRTLAIPTASGGALIASGRELIELDAEARVVRATQARANVSALAELGSDLVAVGETGSVEVAHATADFELAGNLGGNVPEGAALRAGAVLAVVDGHKWVSLELATGLALTLASDPSSQLSGPAALLETRGAALIADSGFVSVRERDGSEALRIGIGSGGPSFDPAARGLRGARVLSDPSGAVAAVQAGNDALLLAADGAARHFDGTGCLDPFRPTPTPGGIVFTCRSGQLFLVSGKAP